MNIFRLATKFYDCVMCCSQGLNRTKSPRCFKYAVYQLTSPMGAQIKYPPYVGMALGGSTSLRLAENLFKKAPLRQLR